MMKIRLKENLPLLLKKRGWTASQLAREAKVSKSSISDWGSGRSPRSLEALKRACEVLDVNVDEILFQDLGSGKEVVSSNEKKLIKDMLGETVLEGTYHLTIRKVKI